MEVGRPGHSPPRLGLRSTCFPRVVVIDGQDAYLPSVPTANGSPQAVKCRRHHRGITFRFCFLVLTSRYDCKAGSTSQNGLPQIPAGARNQ